MSASNTLVSDRRRLPFVFFLLVFALTVPFWLVGWMMPAELMPKLPLSALAVVCPLLAAVILVYRSESAAGARALLARAFDYRRIAQPGWFAAVFLLMPAIMAASYLIQWAMGRALPAFEPQLDRALALLAIFFVSGVAEEIGWSGYAIDPLQERHGALVGALIVGAVWALWHLIPLLQVARPLDWIAAWSLGTVSLRVLTVWIYNNTGRSVFAASLFHAMGNVSWQMFPVAGSSYDPRITGPLEALAAAIIVAYFGARTLRRAPA